MPGRPRPATNDDAALAEADLHVLAADVRIAVLRLARLLRLEGQGDISDTATSVLATVDRLGPITISELATNEHVSVPTMSNVISKLEETGFVSRLRDPSDGRVSRIEITPEGHAYLERTRARRTEWLAGRLDGLSPAELDDLRAGITLLHRMSSPPGEARR